MAVPLILATMMSVYSRLCLKTTIYLKKNFSQIVKIGNSPLKCYKCVSSTKLKHQSPYLDPRIFLFSLSPCCLQWDGKKLLSVTAGVVIDQPPGVTPLSSGCVGYFSRQAVGYTCYPPLVVLMYKLFSNPISFKLILIYGKLYYISF